VNTQTFWTFGRNNTHPQKLCRWFLCLAVLGVFFPRIGLAQVGEDNPTGTSGRFNGNVTTGCSYDPYTGNATRTVTDLVVAGAVGAYPLAFTRTMNTRYTPGAGTLEFGQAGTWRHNYQWSIDPITFTGHTVNWMPSSYVVNYPDGRRVVFASGYQGNDPYYRGPPGVTDRFQPLANTSGGDVYLLLSDGGKVWFQVDVSREPLYDGGPIVSNFTSRFMGLIDPYGAVTTVSYPDDNTMTITEPRGRWLKLSYITTPWNGDTVLDTVSASDGRSVKYNYGGYTTQNGNVYSFLGNVVYFGDSTIVGLYNYQDDNVDPNGRPLIQWAIDCMYEGPMWAIAYTFVPGSAGGVYGQIQSENYLDPSTGNMGVPVSTLAVDDNSRTETRGDSPARTFNYAGSRLVNYTDFKGQTSYLGYDGNGFNASSTNARGYITWMTREPRIGALTLLTHPGDGSTSTFSYTDGNNPYYVASHTDERSNTTSFTRYGNHQVQRIDYPNGAYETFTYNEYGQVLTHRLTSGGIETFRYDEGITPPRGLLTSYVPPPTDSDPDPGSHPTRYHYNALDRVDSMTDPRGNTTDFVYNARGQVTQVIHPPDPQTGVRYSVTNEYDNHGDRISTTDELGHATTFAYDDYKRLVVMTNALQQTTTYDYHPTNGDWNASPYVHATSSLRTTQSPLGKYTSFAYDPNFQRVGLWQADWSGDIAHTGYDYDPAGNLTWVQDPRGYITTLGYDERDRRVWMDDPIASDRNNRQHTMNWDYDGNSNLRFQTRADSSQAEWQYDSMNRVIDTYGFAHEHTHYDRDLAGNVSILTDSKGAAYYSYYDALNRRASQWYPADATGVSRYDAWYRDLAGNVYRHDSPAGNVQIFEYDNRNRMYHSYWWGNVGPNVSTQYDAASRISNVTTNGGETTVAFGYDDVNRKIWEDQTVAGYATHRVQHDRDADGNVSTTEIPGYYQLRYAYTQRNQLAQIQNGGGGPWFNYSYDLSGNMIKRQDVYWGVNDSTNVEDANGTSMYDALNRPTMWEDTHSGDNAFARSFQQYDSLSKLTATWRVEQYNQGERFGYDAMGQLTSVAYSADQVWDTPLNATRTVTYNLDPLNRISVNDNGTQTGYTPDAVNQYTTVGAQNPSYDSDLNLTGYDGASFSYNAQNQLVSASKGGATVQFVYDGLGRCLKRTTNGAATILVYDGWKALAEWAGDGSWWAYRIYGAGPDEVLWLYDSRVGYARVHSDMHGNVTFLLDASGNGVERYTYDAFGQPTIHDWYGGVRSASAYGNRFLFQGREWIAELGIYDFRFRDYQPQLGRFLQKDPLGFRGGDANLFRYCNGDPVNRRDPSGLHSPQPTKQNNAIQPGPGTSVGGLGSWNYGLGSSNSVIATGQGLSTQGFWSTPSGIPTGVGGDPRLGSSGGGGGGDGPDNTSQGGGNSGQSAGTGGYVTVLGNENLNNGLLTFNTLSVGFTGDVPWAFIGDYFGFLLGDVQLSRAGAEARGWLAYYHPELHPTEHHLTETGPIYRLTLFGFRQLYGQTDPYTTAIQIDPALSPTTAGYVNSLTHELIHANDPFGTRWLDQFRDHDPIYYQSQLIQDEYLIHH
jgi:RHS repeat-associated protein